jgi:hypothetical protein
MPVSKIKAPSEQCVEILERALAIWSDPLRRIRGTWKTTARIKDGDFCAMGVLNQAGADVNGVYYYEYAGATNQSDLAGLVGMRDASSVIRTNDSEGKGKGPDAMHARMQEALKRAKESKDV